MFFCSFLFLVAPLLAQNTANERPEHRYLFEQLGTQLPSPNSYRTASGAPGEDYWQQKADYKMRLVLDDKKQRLTGEETITYYNNSPQTLNYIWVQLDQNLRAPNSDTPEIATIDELPDTIVGKVFQESVVNNSDYVGGYELNFVTDDKGTDLTYVVNKTMMRIDLPKPLKNGDKISFNIGWAYNINDRMEDGGRSGYEFFPEDGNYLYTIAQFFPRMAAYTDADGWQNKQFLGQGEFALVFGDYDVEITVPADHILAATGELQNAKKVLTKEQQSRFELAKKTTDKPVFVVTEKEAIENEASRSNETKTWHFKASNVRDFAFATSRKFIWDAMAVPLPGGNTPIAMSLYPKEGNPLWEKESTLAVKNTLELYSERTFDYPYPVAISVHAASVGMEYPMICFNFGRPRADGSYSDGVKWNMITVIVHEIGHNWFPMIVNSDERQWSWMDEGLNTYLETQTMWDRYKDYMGTWGTPAGVANYMKNAAYLRPIMSNSENVQENNFGYNAYGKPAAALNLLRETIMEPELFDYALKEYANRWKFKHPTPADFFRTMEDASAVDLDWFWKGWFFSTDHVDVSVDAVVHYQIAGSETNVEEAKKSVELEISEEMADSATTEQVAEEDFLEMAMIEGPNQVTIADTPFYFYREFRNTVDDAKIRAAAQGKEYYLVTFSNKGGLPTPIVVEFEFIDGSKMQKSVPAEIWRINENEVTKLYVFDKKIVSVTMDPNKKLGDADEDNNIFPRLMESKSRFNLFNSESED